MKKYAKFSTIQPKMKKMRKISLKKLLSEIKPPLTNSNHDIRHSAVAASMQFEQIELILKLLLFAFCLEIMHQIKGPSI